MNHITRHLLFSSPYCDWPFWAEFKAMDSDGSWWFFSERPVPALSGRWVRSTSRAIEERSLGKPTPRFHDWKQSLISLKPEKETT